MACPESHNWLNGRARVGIQVSLTAVVLLKRESICRLAVCLAASPLQVAPGYWASVCLGMEGTHWLRKNLKPPLYSCQQHALSLCRPWEVHSPTPHPQIRVREPWTMHIGVTKKQESGRKLRGSSSTLAHLPMALTLDTLVKFSEFPLPPFLT